MPTTEQVEMPVMPSKGGSEEVYSKSKHVSKIHVENFRGFRDLKLDGLQTVNLIIGQNNAGKTSFLEAITLVMAGKIKDVPLLFRPNDGKNTDLYFKWLLADGAKFGNVVAQFGTKDFRVEFGREELPTSILLTGNSEAGGHHFGWSDVESRTVMVIPIQDLTSRQLIPSFANAVRSPRIQRLLEHLLSKVDSRIRDIRLDYRDDEPFIALDIGLSERVPLSQMGQGVYRLVAIFSELLGEQPEICLIDEIENGIHHTVLKQVWKGIAEVSAMLGIQVFATTHSRECLEAADEVFFREDSENKHGFAVIQLMRVKDQVVGKVLNEARVDAALENDIELR